MSLRKIRSLSDTLAFRLAVYYAAVFTASFFTAFLVFYFMIGSVIEKNRDRDLEGDVQELSRVLMSKGMEGLEDAIPLEMEYEGRDNMFIRVFNASGRVVSSSEMKRWGSMAPSPEARAYLKGGFGYYFETRTVPGREHRVRIIYGAIGPGLMVQVGEYLRKDEEFLEKIREGFGVIMALIIPLATFIGWLMGRQALQGVEQVTQTAVEISRGDLNRRVSVKTKAQEIKSLASTFNEMLDRINALMAGIRNMTDDIAHDLKRPIVRIRVIAERGLYRGSLTDQYDPDKARILEECDSLMQMINTILDVSEAQAGAATLDMSQFDIVGVVLRAHELFYPLAEDKGLNFTMDTPESCLVRGDIHKIQRMIANLLDNAIKYTSSGGDVAVKVEEGLSGLKISVRDTGCGISQGCLPHIFERFYRCDRSRSEPGMGLGLTLAKAIAVSHGGDILVDSTPGKGSTFMIILPLKDPGIAGLNG